MATNFSSFLTGVLPSVPACPRTTAINAVRDAARRLCEDSLAVRKTLTAINTVVGQDIYTLPVTTDMEIIAITYAEYDGVPITPKSPEWLDENDYNWRNAGNGKAQYCFMPSSLQIQLNRKSDSIIAGGLVVEVALKPSITADSCDDSLYIDYKEAVEHGAKHYLMQIPKKEWSDINLSAFHGKHFNFQIQRATAITRRGRNRGSVQSPMRFFA